MNVARAISDGRFLPTRVPTKAATPRDASGWTEAGIVPWRRRFLSDHVLAKSIPKLKVEGSNPLSRSRCLVIATVSPVSPVRPADW